MPFNLTEVSNALRYGVQKTHNYEVHIYTPIQDPFMRELRVMCHTAELPGKDFATKPFTTYGVPRKLPSHINFGEFFALEFYCTGWMRERLFFDTWQSYIANPTNFYFQYFDNYKANIDVTTFTEDGKANYCIRIEDAYPVSVLAQPMKANDQTILNLSVHFAFWRWRNMSDIANEAAARNAVVELQSRTPQDATPELSWYPGPATTTPSDITTQEQATRDAALGNQAFVTQALQDLGRDAVKEPPTPPSPTNVPAAPPRDPSIGVPASIPQRGTITSSTPPPVSYGNQPIGRGNIET